MKRTEGEGVAKNLDGGNTTSILVSREVARPLFCFFFTKRRFSKGLFS